jgi:outer membrane protein OmpU
MKKVLLTSTALVAFAGYASAEVALSGWAEGGVVGGENKATQLWQDVDVDFTMTGSTQGGLEFGANVDLDEAGNLGNQFGNQGVDIFVSSRFGTVTLGDTDGALDRVLTEAGNVGNPGSIDDAETLHPGYLGSYHDGAGRYDGQIVRYDSPTFNGVSFSLSVEQAGGDCTGDLNAAGEGLVDHNADGNCDGAADFDVEDVGAGWALGVRYSGEFNGTTVGIGAGYQYVDDNALGAGAESAEIFGASLDVDYNGIKAGVVYTGGDLMGIEDSSHLGIGAGYENGPFAVHANYGVYDYGDDTKARGYGLSAMYDLGGGMSIHAGYGDGEFEDAAGNTTEADSMWSLGVAMSF